MACVEIDFQNPDYVEIYNQRAERLQLILSDPDRYLPAMRIHYRANPWDFVSDWGMTFDPRLLEKGLPAGVPFVLWPKQKEYLQAPYMQPYKEVKKCD